MEKPPNNIHPGEILQEEFLASLNITPYRFAEIAAPAQVDKTLIYGGSNNEKRTKYNVLSWKNVSG